VSITSAPLLEQAVANARPMTDGESVARLDEVFDTDPGLP
jgi:hypothetical protein